MESPKKPSAGRPAAIPLSLQLEYFKKRKDELLENGCLKTASAQIFKDIYDDGLHMDARNMVRVIERYSIQIFGTTVSRQNPKSAVSKEMLREFLDDTEITIELSEEDKKFFVIKDKKVSPSCSHQLDVILRKHFDPDCLYKFDKTSIKSNEIEMIGMCEKCNKQVVAITCASMSRLSVKFSGGTAQHTTEYKRRYNINAANKENYIEELRHSSAFNVRNAELDKIVREGGFGASAVSVPSAGALRVLKCRANKEKDDVLTVLHKFKYLDDRFKNTIHKISTVPFQLIFWTPFQVFVYKRLRQIQKYITICIDATGSLIDNQSLLAALNIRHEVKHLPHIFLYLITVKTDDGKSIPIAQFLSADQHYVETKYFLEKFSNDFKRPNEIHTDRAPPLIKACVITNTSCTSTNDYIDKCFKFLTKESNDLPEVLIRNDVAHVVKNFHKKKVFNGVPMRVKQFYLCVLGFILQCESFAVIQETFKHLLIVCSNECEGKMLNGKNLPTRESIDALQQIVSTHSGNFLLEKFEKNENQPEENFEESEIGSSEKQNNDESTWFDKLIPKIDIKKFSIKEMSSKMRINAYFCEKMQKFLKDEFNKLPFWTSVMKNPFCSPHDKAVTSDIESHMKNIKHVIMGDINLPCRVDTFIEKYVQSVNGQAKEFHDKFAKVKYLFNYCY